MIVTTPHRHDLSATSCINKEVQNFNKKLHKIMKNKDNVRILDHEPTRDDFTQHGLHLNATGNTKIAKLVAQNISLLSENRKKHPIILQWTTTLHDTSTVNNIPTVQNEEYMIVGNEGGNEDQVDSINQRIESSSLANGILKAMKDEKVVIKNKERNEDQTDFKNQGLRTSAKTKEISQYKK